MTTQLLRYLERTVLRVLVTPVRTGVFRATSDDANDARKDGKTITEISSCPTVYKSGGWIAGRTDVCGL